jgi:hypothetical protein
LSLCEIALPYCSHTDQYYEPYRVLTHDELRHSFSIYP